MRQWLRDSPSFVKRGSRTPAGYMRRLPARPLPQGIRTGWHDCHPDATIGTSGSACSIDSWIELARHMVTEEVEAPLLVVDGVE